MVVKRVRVECGSSVAALGPVPAARFKQLPAKIEQELASEKCLNSVEIEATTRCKEARAKIQPGMEIQSAKNIDKHIEPNAIHYQHASTRCSAPQLYPEHVLEFWFGKNKTLAVMKFFPVQKSLASRTTSTNLLLD